MSTLTIRNLGEDVKARLRRRAADNGRSMEEEVRDILRTVTAQAEPPKDLGRFLRELAAPYGGFELDIPAREMGRDPPTFE